MKQQSRKLSKSRDKVIQKSKNKTKGLLQKQTDKLVYVVGDYSIHLGQPIGQGASGKVYKATKNGSTQQFACKLIKQQKIDNLYLLYKDKKIAEQAQQRIRLEGQFQLKLSKCPYIARLYKTQKTQKGFFFIMEHCQTDLAKLLQKEGFLKQDIALRYFKQIVEGIKFIYQKNAFHRDLKVKNFNILKPQNLLIKNDTIKISDFGFVKIFSEIDRQCKSKRNRYQAQSKVGTVRYMSPDILALIVAQSKLNQQTTENQSSMQSSQNNQTQKPDNDILKNYNPEKSDIWSLGIILYKMLYGKQPYDGRSQQEMIKKIQEQKLDFPGSIQLAPGKIVKTKVSKDIIKLIKKMLLPDQNERIDFMKLYSKLKSIMEQKQKQRLRSGIQQGQQQVQKNSSDQTSMNKKERLLIVYNKIMVRIYKDLSSFATIRQIGIENYSEFSYKIMTLIHQKRTTFLESQDNNQDRKDKKVHKPKQSTQIDEKIKQQISQYHNVFYEQIKTLSNLKPQDNLKSLLMLVYKCLQKYQDYELLIKEVQLYLLFLLQLLCLELGIIKQDYICATQDKAETLKIKSILNFKNDAMKLIFDNLNGGQIKQKNKKSGSKQRSNSKQEGKQLMTLGKNKQRTSSKSKHTKEKSQKKQRSHRRKEDQG